MSDENSSNGNWIQTYVPRAPLSAFVDCFWHMDGYLPIHQEELAIPDGSVELIIDLREDPIRLFDKDQQELIFTHSILCGPHSEHFIIDTGRETAVIGIHFKPGGAGRFFRLPLNELYQNHVSLDTLWGVEARDLRDELLFANTPDQRFRILEAHLLSCRSVSWSRDRAIEFALAELQNLTHAQPVSTIVDQLGMSSRSFIQRFQAEVGMTPKRFQRLTRFQLAIALIGQGSSLDWADIAVACGYYDQSHFIKDFTAFSGLKPTEYHSIDKRHPNHVPIHL